MCLQIVHDTALSGFPLPTPLPLKYYQPKKIYLCLSAGNTQNPQRKEPYMKQTAQKKPKVFRTLIRLIHTGDRPAQEDSHIPGLKEKCEYRRDSPLSFSAGKKHP